MKAAELRELGNEDLIEKLSETKESLMKLKINHKVAELENPIQIRVIRKNVARLNTEIRNRKLNSTK